MEINLKELAMYLALIWIPGSNMFWILAILTTRDLRKKKSVLLILNQALADFFVGFVSTYYNAGLPGVYERKDFDVSNDSQRNFLETMCFVVFCFQTVFAICSAMTMVVINLERYLFICHSFWYRNTIRSRHILCLALFPWVASLAATIPMITKGREELVHKNMYNRSMNVCYESEDSEEITPDAHVTLFWCIGYILIPLPAIIFFNTRIIKTAYHSAKQRINLTGLSEEFNGASASRYSMDAPPRSTSNSHGRRHVEPTRSVQSQLLRRLTIKNIRTLVTFNIFFVAMWLPLVVFEIVTTLVPSFQDAEVFLQMRYVLAGIAILNSGINPFLWLMYPDYRAAYWQLLKKCGLRYCKKPSTAGSQ